MVAQSVQPLEWLFVDDGSRDDTRAIIESYAAQHSWIRVISRDDRGFRQLGTGVIVAFDYVSERLANPGLSTSPSWTATCRSRRGTLR